MKRTLSIFAALLLAMLPVSAADKRADELHLKREDLPAGIKVKDDIIYKQAGSQPLAMMLFEPVENKPGKSPLVVYIHGGGWTGGDRYKVLRPHLLNVLRELTQQGVTCASIEYRLAKPGIATVMDSVADCKDALRFLANEAGRFGIDPDRIAVFGESAGGHLCLVTALGEEQNYPCDHAIAGLPVKIRCVAAFYPRVSFSDPEMLATPRFPLARVRKDLQSILGGPLDERREIIRKLSPIELVRANSPVIFLAHGDADDILPVRNATAMRDAARAKGVPVECIICKGAGHCFDGKNIDPPDQEIVCRTVAFFVKNLGVSTAANVPSLRLDNHVVVAASLPVLRRQSTVLAWAGHAQGVGIHAEFEVREFLRSGNRELADKAVARLEGIADACTDAKATEKVVKGTGGWFFERYPFYFACWKLEEKGLLSAELRKKLAPLRELPKSAGDQITGYERGVNNRAFNFCGDALVEAINHPDNPLANDYRKYAETCWRDWVDLGTTPEVMPSYNRPFLAAILDLAEMMGKEDELRTKMAGEFKRYFRQMSGNGVRGGDAEAMASLIGAKEPAMGVPGWYALDDIYGNPWDANCTMNYVDIAIKAARVFRDPEYIWYARTLLANGDIPDKRLSPEAKAAIAERLGEFERDGIKIEIPQDRSFVSTLPFRSGAIADRVILMPQRAGTGPFAAFYVFDRLEGFMHGPAGQTGRLYDFSVDGSLLLRQGGKYSHGPWWENTVLMTEPWKNFPSPRPGAVPSGRWTTATVSLLAGRSRWQGDGEYVRDSAQGVFEVARGMPFIKQTNPLPTHRLWGNYNVFTHADDSTLTSLPLHFVLVPAKGTAYAIDGGQYVGSSNPGTDTPMTLTVENLRLVGPKGEKPVGDLGAFDDTEVVFTPPSMDRARNKRFDHQRLTGTERQAAVKIVAGSKPGRRAWQIMLKPGTTSILLPVRDKFDLTKDYTRLALDYKYDGDTSAWLRLPIGLGTGVQWYEGTGFSQSQGAILQTARAEQHGGDSLGIMEFGNVSTAGTRWTRRALLTQEGIMLICDDLSADQDADGWTGGVLWHLAPDWKKNPTDETPIAGDGWFDAPPFNRAVWQKAPKRLLVWFRSGSGLSTGTEKCDTAWNGSWAVWQKGTLAPGKTQRFITLLVPHDTTMPAAQIVKNMRSTVDEQGKIEASCGGVHISLSPGNEWQIGRN